MRGGRNKASAHTMFVFGKSAGWVEMALVGNRIPHQYVLPSMWQSVVNAPKKRKSERQDIYKTRLRRYAQTLCDVKLTKATADAFLIALYCARIRGVSW